MKLIIEAGSSKTESRLINRRNVIVSKHTSDGINPVTDPSYTQSLAQLTELYEGVGIEEIHYCGSGCINSSVNRQISNHMQSVFGDVRVTVNDDLFGSARSAFGDHPGLIVIVGTGSIIGYSDGHQIRDKLASGGYLLGDEGSGYDIGREIMIRFCRGQFNAADSQIIEEHIGMKSDEFIAGLYKHENPRKYLASMAKLINNIEAEQRYTILNKVFIQMSQNMIVPMWEKYGLKPHFVGSVAFYFEEFIRENLMKFDILAGSFRQAAIDGLVQYHRYE